jgi:hypothetical protein
MSTTLDGDRDGATFDSERDGSRLNRQMRDVWAHMSTGKPYTLDELARLTNHPEASISARIRDLRKAKHGGHTVERWHLGQGVWIYQLVLPTTDAELSGLGIMYPCTWCGAGIGKWCVLAEMPGTPRQTLHGQRIDPLRVAHAMGGRDAFLAVARATADVAGGLPI